MYSGLSFEQAPPVSAVMRFFLTVPIFGIILTLLVGLHPSEILIASHPLSLASIHVMFLGIITMAMFGALFQMQSVLGGYSIPNAAGNAFLIHLFLSIGTLSLGSAFVFVSPPLFVVAAVFLGSSILYTAKLILPLLFRGSSHDTLRGMKIALISLAIVALLGIVMASEYANETFGSLHEVLRTIHYSFGLIGWIAVLIIAVAFQVVEMFYVTAPYSSWCKRNALLIIALSLGLKALWTLAALLFAWIFDVLIGLLLIGFIATTMKRLLNRKRRVSDVSIWFWFFGIGLLFVSLSAYTIYSLSGIELFQPMALVAFALFALSIILGMIGKIVPFLIWFHLNAAGYMDTPIMSNIITHTRAKLLFVLFVSTALFTLVGSLYHPFLSMGAIMGSAMFALLFYNIFTALALYAHTVRFGVRFDFDTKIQ